MWLREREREKERVRERVPLVGVNLSKLYEVEDHRSNLMWTTIMAATIRHQSTVAVRGVVQ